MQYHDPKNRLFHHMLLDYCYSTHPNRDSDHRHVYMPLFEYYHGTDSTTTSHYVSNPNHFFVEADGCLVDIPGSAIRVDGLPEPPEHLRISHIDVVVRLVRK